MHQLSEADEVTTFKNPADQFTLTMTIMDSTTAVFSLMYAAALGLAFVICYNMGADQLYGAHPRLRHPQGARLPPEGNPQPHDVGKQSGNRAGRGAGVWPGILLTQVVLSSVRSENNVFLAHVSLQTIVIASAITCLFSILIEW